MLVTIKFIIARWKKDEIYKYGIIIGPIGFIGWSLSHWTSLYNFYIVKLPTSGDTTLIAPNNFIWAAIFPFFVGVALFMFVLIKRGHERKERGKRGRQGVLKFFSKISINFPNCVDTLP